MAGAERVTMVEVDDGCRLWTSASGDGEALVCCHGGPGLWDMFGDFGGLLGDLATVHRWDQRGCGRSERRGPYSLATSVADPTRSGGASASTASPCSGTPGARSSHCATPWTTRHA